MFYNFNFPEKSIQNKEMNLSHFDFTNKVDKVTLIASINSHTANLLPVKNDPRYSELHFIEVCSTEYDYVYDICKQVFKKITYACVILFRYENKYKVAVCKIRENKIDNSKNKLEAIHVSSWIHPDLMSKDCSSFINNINEAFLCDNTKSIFNHIYASVHEYLQGGLTRAKVYRYIENNFSYAITDKRKKEILKYCTPYRCCRHSSNVRDKYKKKEKNPGGPLIHDFEDLYYCFMMDDETKKYEDIFSNIRKTENPNQITGFKSYKISDNELKRINRRTNKKKSRIFETPDNTIFEKNYEYELERKQNPKRINHSAEDELDSFYLEQFGYDYMDEDEILSEDLITYDVYGANDDEEW